MHFLFLVVQKPSYALGTDSLLPSCHGNWRNIATMSRSDAIQINLMELNRNLNQTATVNDLIAYVGSVAKEFVFSLPHSVIVLLFVIFGP
jgi:hypothetical protein